MLIFSVPITTNSGSSNYGPETSVATEKQGICTKTSLKIKTLIKKNQLKTDNVWARKIQKLYVSKV